MQCLRPQRLQLPTLDLDVKINKRKKYRVCCRIKPDHEKAPLEHNRRTHSHQSVTTKMEPAKYISPVHGTILSVLQNSYVFSSLSHGFPPYMASATIFQDTSLVPLFDPQDALQGLELISILQSTETKVCTRTEEHKRRCSNLCNTCDQRLVY